MAVHKKKTKKLKYKRITFKLSNKEFAKIDNYTKNYNITLNKLVKKALRLYLKNNINNDIDIKIDIDKSQMSIFDIIDETK